MITNSILIDVFPNTPKADVDDIVINLNRISEKYSINTNNRMSAFLAEIGHESQQFLYREENLNYSDVALIKVFPKYFPNEKIAKPYDRNPEKIANKIYANRMGNGTEESGDGWMFRGRGYMQITGREMISNFAKSIQMELSLTLPYLTTIAGSCDSSGWFWNLHNLNHLADAGLIDKISEIINGGTIGLADRRSFYEKMLKFL